ncbi:MAG TPA: ATP-binding cassette domain-containing protein [Pseudobdellovibrionaceae bacterium]|nr:ATP-binding cassette domain-containing protein [Pseudobdellovibrionaceae bacterium]
MSGSNPNPLRQINLLQVQSASKSFGARSLFQGLKLSVNEGEHIGVIGPNGAGKTTLFKVLAGLDEFDSGQIVRSHKLRLGYLAQEEIGEDLSRRAEDVLREVSQRPLWEMLELGQGLGLKPEHFASPLRELSGGYRMRVKLLCLLAQEPNLLLLDEPTNFLDLESVLTLERFLVDYEGAFLLISHDREFLRRVTDHTLEIEQGEATKFPGNLDDYFEQKEQLRKILEAQAAQQADQRARIEDFVARFGAKATKARQAQSRLKRLEKMEKIEIKKLPTRARIRLPLPQRTGREILRLEQGELGYPDRTILREVDLRLERGQHIGVVGFNGAGKSTLLKTLAGRLPLRSGQLAWGADVRVAYYAQHVADELRLDQSVWQSLSESAPRDLPQQDVLDLAGALLFSGDAIQKPIRVLSGGEKSRVALGRLLLQRCPLLLLDEPTNHLDFDTVEALTEALRAYEGSVVVVSHDRSFISRVATQILEIDDGRARVYPGTYDEYVWSLERGAFRREQEKAQAQTRSEQSESVRSQAASGVESSANSSSTASTSSKMSLLGGADLSDAKLKALKREAERQQLKLEVKLQQAEIKARDVESQLGQANPHELTVLAEALRQATEDVAGLEEELLQVMTQLEHFENLERERASGGT